MTKQIGLVLAAALVFACHPNPTPQPPQPTPPPGPVCQPAQFCDCWHNPAGTEWLLATCGAGQVCDSAKQCVTAPPVDPEPQAFIPDAELKPTEIGPPSLMWSATASAIARYKAAHPEKWNADKTCLVATSAGVAAAIDAAYEAISGQLGARSIVAAQSVRVAVPPALPKKSDCIFVNRPGTDLYEEMHVFEYGRGCAATGTNAMRGVYMRVRTSPLRMACESVLM